MARMMFEKQTEVYRTVVRVTYLEDSPMTREYDWASSSYIEKPRWRAGQSFTDVFGPYSSKSVNQNYSYHNGWQYTYNEETKKQDYVKVADVVVEKQVLKPVLALNQNGSLELALDWVTYDRRG